MSPVARADEIAHWSACMNSPEAFANALASADSVFNLFRLLEVDRPETDAMLDYLDDRGGYSDVGSRPLERALFSLFAGAPANAEDAVSLALKLAEPVESGYLFESIAAIYVQAYGAVEASRILREASMPGDANSASRLAAYAAALARTDAASALDIIDHACAIGPDPIGSLARWRERLRELIATLAIS
jgi:hypothetical protein